MDNPENPAGLAGQPAGPLEHDQPGQPEAVPHLAGAQPGEPQPEETRPARAEPAGAEPEAAQPDDVLLPESARALRGGGKATDNLCRDLRMSE